MTEILSAVLLAGSCVKEDSHSPCPSSDESLYEQNLNFPFLSKTEPANGDPLHVDSPLFLNG